MYPRDCCVQYYDTCRCREGHQCRDHCGHHRCRQPCRINPACAPCYPCVPKPVGNTCSYIIVQKTKDQLFEFPLGDTSGQPLFFDYRLDKSEGIDFDVHNSEFQVTRDGAFVLNAVVTFDMDKMLWHDPSFPFTGIANIKLSVAGNEVATTYGSFGSELQSHSVQSLLIHVFFTKKAGEKFKILVGLTGAEFNIKQCSVTGEKAFTHISVRECH